jgi:hypothetical protein
LASRYARRPLGSALAAMSAVIPLPGEADDLQLDIGQMTLGHPDVPGRPAGEIDDPTFHIGAAVVDRDVHAFPVPGVGDSHHRAEG